MRGSVVFRRGKVQLSGMFNGRGTRLQIIQAGQTIFDRQHGKIMVNRIQQAVIPMPIAQVVRHAFH